MSNENINKFSEVVKSADLLEINLQSSSSECLVAPSQIVPANIELNYIREVKYSLSKERDILFCFVSMQATGTPTQKQVESVQEQNAKKHIFLIKGTFALIYKLSNKELDEKMISAFASQNAFYNAYPYFREFFHDMCTRFGIAPIRLPLLKPPSKKELSKDL